MLLIFDRYSYAVRRPWHRCRLSVRQTRMRCG